jgi:predicted dehydrogenase
MDSSGLTAKRRCLTLARSGAGGKENLLTDRPLGYALVGAGGFGDYCASHFGRMDEVRPVAVWNRTAEKAAHLAARHGLRHHQKLDDLLADPAVELVHIATTPELHAPQALAALGAGKHVLVEKPLALTTAAAEEICRLAEEKDLRVGVNFMMRHGPLAAAVARLVRARPLGSLLRGQLLNCAGDEGLAPGHWFWDRARSGGIFVEHGVHHFDLAAYWLGPGRVVGAQRFRRPGAEVVDQVSCTVAYGEETSFGFYHGFHQGSRVDRQEIRLVFERGELTLRGWVSDRLEMTALVEEHAREELRGIFPGAHVEVVEDLGGRIAPRRWREESMGQLLRLEWSAAGGRDEVYGAALRALLADLAAAVREDGRRPLAGGEQGRAALLTALEAERLAGETCP